MDAKSYDESPRHDECEAAEIATHAEYGNVGDVIALVTNFVELKKIVTSEIVIRQYDVKITGKETKLTKEDKQNAFWTFVQQYPKTFTDPFSLAYDGQSILLVNDSSENKEFEILKGEVCVHMLHTHYPVGLTVEARKVGLTKLKFKNELHQSLPAEAAQRSIQMLNTILSQGRLCPLTAKPESFCVIDGTIFEVASKIDLKGGAEIRRGLFTEAKITDGCLPLVNVDLTYETFYRRQALLQYICDVLNSRQQKQRYAVKQIQSDTALSNSEWKIIKAALIGLHVNTICRDTTLQYPIIDAVPQAAKHELFMHDGQKINVADYFRKKYGALQYPCMPAVGIGSKSQCVYLPVEMCLIPEKLRYDGAKLLHVQKMLLNQGRQIDTATRLQHCLDMMQKFEYQNDKFLKSFGIALSSHFVQTRGRVLQAPALEYRCKRLPVVVHPVNGIWQMDEKCLFKPANCSNYSAISFLHRNRLHNVVQFCKNVANACNEMGMRMSTNADMVIPVANTKDLEWAIDLVLDVYKQRGMTCELIFVAVNCVHHYAAAKYIADVKYGITTCCVKADIFRNALGNKCTGAVKRLPLKLNLVLGGVNSHIADDFVTKTHLIGKCSLVLAADTVHVGSTNNESPLIRVLVGNTDDDCARYEASVDAELCSEEELTTLKQQFRERILSYRSGTGRNPQQVILFVVNVPEKIFKEELHCKLKAFRLACHSLGTDYRPNLTIVVVTTEHHTYFTVNDKTMTEKVLVTTRLLPIGTVVDRRIISAGGCNYYLSSNAEMQESNKPTKYYVIYDENKLDADVIQAISYYLCYLNGCVTYSISVPAPVHFAQLACQRAQQHLQHALENEDLADSQGKNGSRISEILTNAISVHEKIRNTMYFV
ncbi:PAZ and Piwi domain containing protein [Trichuris trichiura]|uniref:PAZ and Piwi domain containing protein n=1 Tax=Trichuris trichiura TaxID=36087 RepID=A0A077Z0S9_TRITR|nr:PAZ and Piwi domain containing protein [Trichuris trichiura]